MKSNQYSKTTNETYAKQAYLTLGKATLELLGALFLPAILLHGFATVNNLYTPSFKGLIGIILHVIILGLFSARWQRKVIQGESAGVGLSLDIRDWKYAGKL